MSAIIIKFKPGQPRRISVEGVHGPICNKLTEPFEALLGKVIVRSPTAEAAMVEIPLDQTQSITE